MSIYPKMPLSSETDADVRDLAEALWDEQNVSKPWKEAAYATQMKYLDRAAWCLSQAEQAKWLRLNGPR